MPCAPGCWPSRRTPSSASSSGRSPCCPSAPPSRTTCTCPTAPTITRWRRSARRACEGVPAGAKVLLLPTMPFGVNTNHLQGARRPGVQRRRRRRCCALIDRPGRFAGTAGRPQAGAAQRPRRQRAEAADARAAPPHQGLPVRVRLVSAWPPTCIRSIFEKPGEHADEVETSLGLAFFPELLKPELADDGAARPTRFDAINRGWVSITRPWHLVSDQHRPGRSVGGDGGEGAAS